MADYQSAYTGAEIDAAVARAQGAVQYTETGWAQYSDTQYTSGSPLAISADTDTVLPNNAGAVIESQKPTDITSFYADGKITGRNGDGLLITVNAKLLPTSASTSLAEIWFDIGGSVGEIYRRPISFPKGNGIVRPFSFTVAAYTLGTWEANGATPYIRANGTLSIYDIDYILTRSHKAR
jgi:hypothetical protein